MGKVGRLGAVVPSILPIMGEAQGGWIGALITPPFPPHQGEGEPSGWGWIVPQTINPPRCHPAQAGIHAEGRPGAGCVRGTTDLDSGLRRNDAVG
jgi:hypothetical protein